MRCKFYSLHYWGYPRKFGGLTVMLMACGLLDSVINQLWLHQQGLTLKQGPKGNNRHTDSLFWIIAFKIQTSSDFLCKIIKINLICFAYELNFYKHNILFGILFSKEIYHIITWDELLISMKINSTIKSVTELYNDRHCEKY